jgi:predicted fused transcriptional regulator/phosphomethylpyrimidine kinase
LQTQQRTPHVRQRRAVNSGDGAPNLMSEEGWEGKEAVCEHQRHTARSAEELVRTGRARMVLATCAMKGTAAH